MSAIIDIQKNDFSLPLIQILHADLVQISRALKQFAPNDVDETFSLPCVLSIEVEGIQPTFLAQLVEALRQLSFMPVALKTEDESYFEQAHYLGLAVFNHKMSQFELFDSATKHASSAGALKKGLANSSYTHHGNVYTGEQVYAKGCDLVVLGDVEAGAEVIADGNIYIGGSLNGRAYAANSGSMNIDEVTIRAYVFEPELISIAGFYQLKADIAEHYLGLSIKAKFIAQRFAFTLE